MSDFDDLLAANRTYADSFDLDGLPGAAGAGVGIVTCMDSRIDPLAVLGLEVGDAKIVRNPGGQVTDDALTAMVLAANLLQVDRILVIEHTRCAMASSTEAQLHERLDGTCGTDTSWLRLGAIADQHEAIREGVHRIASHPLVPDSVTVGGFVYDVDSGLLQQVV